MFGMHPGRCSIVIHLDITVISGTMNITSKIMPLRASSPHMFAVGMGQYEDISCNSGH
jgi:hypothetical protein